MWDNRMVSSAVFSIVSIGSTPRVTVLSLLIRNLSNPSHHHRYFSVYLQPQPMSTTPSATQRQHFLLKSEPHEYSIQQLRQDQREEWNGVRNYTARNHLQTMKQGDRCFFYHSSCKSPSIVGTCHIARTAQPDTTAIDPTHKYFDPKSIKQDNNKKNNKNQNNNNNINRWVSVLVEFEALFETPITIKELRAQAIINPVIADMTLLRRPRLSVMPVSPEEWQAVLDLQSRKELGEDLLQVVQEEIPKEREKTGRKKRTKSATPKTAVKKESTNLLNLDDLGYCSEPDCALSTNQVKTIVDDTATKLTEKELGLTGRKHLYIIDGDDNLEPAFVYFFEGNKFVGKDRTRMNRMMEAANRQKYHQQSTSKVYLLLSENSGICKRITLPKLLEDGVIVQRVA
jgi:predicted RNA-binding protein with PUA-like domain